MASLVKYDDGLRRIDFMVTPGGPRRSIRLGRTTARQAEAILAKVEVILADNIQQRPHDAEVSSWLSTIDETLLSRLRNAGLADGVGTTQIALGDFLQRAFDAMTVKPATKVFYGHTRRNLEKHFTTGRMLRSIKFADADGWRTWLVNQGLSKATVGRRVIAARSMWRTAVRWNLASENPFDGVRGGMQVNDSRKFFVSTDVVEQVMEQASDAEWRLVIALARYGGLRCPSEIYALRWSDIDHVAGTINVSCPKLAHHEGKGSRLIPLFPELQHHLLAASEEATKVSGYVIEKHRLDSLNLRQQFMRFIECAGIEPWPRLFQNLRASRETELMREFDLATVCKWIGNSPAVAARHYAMSVDLNADFARAIASLNTQQKAQQSADEGHCSTMTRRRERIRKPQKNRQKVNHEQELANRDQKTKWAMRELEPLRQLWFKHKQAVQGNRADRDWLVTCLMYNEKLAVEVARAMMLDPGTKPADKQLPLLTLAKANRPEDEGLIVFAMNDSTVVDTRIRAGKTIKTQLRDIALACMIHRAGRKPGDYGFKNIRTGDLTVYAASSLGFSDDSDRLAAFSAWYESDKAPAKSK